MKHITEVYSRTSRPIKVLQFGEGNFLRAFVDYAIDVANESGKFNGNVAVVIPIPADGIKKLFNEQNNLYTVCLRGKKEGQVYEENRVITCIEKVLGAYGNYNEYMELAHLDSLEFIVSNTTEAGIVFDETDKFEAAPPTTFPGKLTKFLYERFNFFKGDTAKGLTMLPVELIEKNGENLKKCVLQFIDLWKLPSEFKTWVENSCTFAGTLVDRIVTGFPRDSREDYAKELGYEDNLIDIAEPFGLWVIGENSIESKLPINSNKLSVEFTNDIEVYKERKVRILNGAHTSMVLGAYLAGLDYVSQCMADSDIRKQLTQSVYSEIVPTVHMPLAKATEFADAVFERFENPYVKHALLSISLNSISKWRARVLPSLKDSLANTGKLPKWLTYSLAALLAFYRTTEAGAGCLIGYREGKPYEIHDDADKLAFIKTMAGESTAKYVSEILKRTDFWGEDLTQIKDLEQRVIHDLNQIEMAGIKNYINALGKN
ncbi:MAG: tagaturonate reductase [Alphaproteobacteria bacterium]|jgi:tagaturonate reductase|nr:tagaturonate reductase [Alphaproteobacteria bacterium]